MHYGAVSVKMSHKNEMILFTQRTEIVQIQYIMNINQLPRDFKFLL